MSVSNPSVIRPFRVGSNRHELCSDLLIPDAASERTKTIWIDAPSSPSPWQRPRSARLRRLSRRPRNRPPKVKALSLSGRSGADPTGTFRPKPVGLKDVWPAAGPRVVWKRALGEGYSSPAVENGVLYTMYGKPREEVVLAADAETGTTLWEHATRMTFQSDAPEMGNGPYATPLIVGDRLFTTGVAGRLQCLDKKTGKLLWTQQLWTDHQGSRLMYGYASSPHRVSGDGHRAGRRTGASRVMAFQQADGKVAWAKDDFGNVYSSPLLINVGGPRAAGAS